jgi:polyisoprenyl-teichoic acid--peptidoglycan teichoic acid transferase
MKLKNIRLARVKVGFLHFLQSNLKVITLILLLGLFLLGFFKVKLLLDRLNFTPQKVTGLFQDPINHLQHSDQRTNFLLLGTKGENQADVDDLADTIILASFHHLSKQTTIISVPRDLWVASLKTKINAVYHYGQQRDPPVGTDLVKGAIQETLGLPVHYIAVINFNSFTEAIDVLDGVEVDVQHSFTDSLFPIPGKENVYPIEDRYQTVSFEKGLQVMNGETALKFVRSRHAEGEEGTDFARSKRQQLVLSALRSKLTSTNLLFNKGTRTKLINIVQENLATNLVSDDYPSLINLVINSKDKPFSTLSLSTNTTDDNIAILENPPRYLYQNQWVLIAKDNNWKALKQYVQNNLSQ